MRNSERIRPYSSSVSSKVIDLGVNQKPICDFLLVINNNFGRILHRFQDIAAQRSKNRFFALPHPPLRPPLGGTCQNFWMKLTLEKLERWGYCMVKIA